MPLVVRLTDKSEILAMGDDIDWGVGIYSSSMGLGNQGELRLCGPQLIVTAVNEPESAVMRLEAFADFVHG